jgi:hypothetical protein
MVAVFLLRWLGFVSYSLDGGVGFSVFVEGGGGLALVSLFDVVVEDDHFFLALQFDIGGLDGAVPALFAFPLVEFAHGVDFPDDLSVDVDALPRLELLLVEHAQVQHLVLDFWMGGGVQRQVSETLGSQFGVSLKSSSQASTTL